MLRREFVKGYLVALLAEGALKPSDLLRPAELPGKVWRTVLKADILPAAREVAEMVAARAAERVGEWAADTARATMGRVASEIGRRGLGGLWEDVRTAYERGADANAGTNRRRP